jgi:hypothetical protein
VSRIHSLVDGEDKARWEAQAAREGRSLGAWLREAADDRYRAARDTRPFTAPEELETFFARCDAREGTPEPDWEEHRAILDVSRRRGAEPT